MFDTATFVQRLSQLTKSSNAKRSINPMILTKEFNEILLQSWNLYIGNSRYIVTRQIVENYIGS